MERRVESSASVHASTATASAILRSTPELVLGECATGRDSARRTFHTTLPASVRPGTTIEQTVSVTIGPIRSPEADGRTNADFSWKPVGPETVLPSFVGELSLEPLDGHNSRLRVRGLYRVPMGRLGQFGDSVVGHRVARRSLSLYVRRLADRIDRESVRRNTAANVKPAPYNDDLRPHSPSARHRG